MSESQEELAAKLVDDVLDSFEKLEVLMSIAGVEGSRSVEAICERVTLDPDIVEEALASLVTQGVIVALTDGYVLATEGPWSPHVRALAKLYKSDRMQVVTLMSEAAMRRLRSKADRAFSDAFLFRWKKGDHDS
jgi:predicted transcriptional regulator